MTREENLWRIWGLRLAKRRTAANLTQAQLAERVHVAQGTVSKWEKGTLPPDDGSKYRLAEVLERSVDELFAWPEFLPPERAEVA